MTASRGYKLEKEMARNWLAKHEPKRKPKPGRQTPERWELRRREQKQQRRDLATPLLKGVE
jgi:hypothetical protein